MLCRMPSQNYADLTAWQKAMDLAQAVYDETRTWPKEELYGLIAQLRRAAVSVPSNIAEGQGRRAPREFHRFLSIAHGSVREVETQLLLGARFAYTSQARITPILNLAGEVGKLITGLANSLAL